MFKAILFGLLSSLLAIVVFGFLISQFLPAQFVPLGAPGWRQQHDQLLSINTVQWLKVLGWTLIAGVGGFVSTRTSPTRTLRAATWIGAIFLLVWGIPGAIIAGSQMDWVHFTSCLLILPAALMGGMLANRMAGPNPRVS